MSTSTAAIDNSTLEEVLRDDQWGYDYAQREYQYGKEYLIPWLLQNGINLSQFTSAIDLGCGFGGVVVALSERGMKCDGLDYSPRVLKVAQVFAQQRGFYPDFFQADLNRPLCDSMLVKQQYEIVFLRDVLEHIPHPAHTLANIWQILAPGGLVFVEFPPYYSAYGGHQHYRRHPLLRLPFMHLPPMRLLFRVPVFTKNDEAEYLEEIRVLELSKLSLHKFETLYRMFGFSVLINQHFLIRPIFKMRFGLPILRLPLLGKVPYLRELMVTGTIYVLRKPAHETL